jgi:hypothetical protein
MMEEHNNLDTLAAIIAYDQIRSHEEHQLIESLFKLIAGRPSL